VIFFPKKIEKRLSDLSTGHDAGRFEISQKTSKVKNSGGLIAAGRRTNPE
jgi:hypothetical protein